MAPQLIVCLRHGEKRLGPDGKEIAAQPGLSERGFRRADRLAHALRPGALLPDDAAQPTDIFAPRYADGAERHRSYQTVAPLAAELTLSVTTPCAKRDVGRLAEAVLAVDSVAVVCWEHACLAAWLQRFAGVVAITRQGDDSWLPCEWESGRFDVVWLLRRDDGGYRFSAHNQALLAGDRDYTGDEHRPPA